MTTPIADRSNAKLAAAAALGNDRQRARFENGWLPEEELLAIARTELFKPFDETERRYSSAMKIKYTDIRHTPACTYSEKVTVDGEEYLIKDVSVRRFGTDAKIDERTKQRIVTAARTYLKNKLKVTFATSGLETFPGDVWNTFQRVCLAASRAAQHDWLELGAVDVIPLRHESKCGVCGASVERFSAKVTIAWAGHLLTREYMLGETEANPTALVTPS